MDGNSLPDSSGGGNESHAHEATRYPSVDACRQRSDGTGAGVRPRRAIPVHAAAADQDLAIDIGAELSTDSRCGTAGASATAVALISLPCGACTGPIRTSLFSPSSNGAGADHLRTVCAKRNVRRPCYELRTRGCGGRIRPQSTERFHGPLYALNFSAAPLSDVERAPKPSCIIARA